MATTAASGAGKTHKKRPFTKDEAGGAKAAQPKKAKTSSSESECVEVSSSSDEPRATSPRRRSRAPLDQFVRVESPVSEVSTSCDLVDLASEDKENRVEPPPRDAEMTEVMKEKAGGDAEVTKAGEDAEMKKEKAGEDVGVKKENNSDVEEVTRAKITGDVSEETVKTSGDTGVEKSAVIKDGCVSELSEEAKSNEKETAVPLQINKGDDASVTEKTDKSDSVLCSKAIVGNKSEGVTKSFDHKELEIDNKSETSDSAAGSEKSKGKVDESSQIDVETTVKNSEVPSVTSDKNDDVPMPEVEEKSPTEEEASATDTAASAVPMKPAVDVNSPKASGPELEAKDQVNGGATDSEKDGEADDESADDIVVLDEAKLKPTEAEAASNADNATGGSSTPSTKRPVITKKKTPKQKERERIRAKREQEKQVSSEEAG